MGFNQFLCHQTMHLQLIDRIRKKHSENFYVCFDKISIALCNRLWAVVGRIFFSLGFANRIFFESWRLHTKLVLEEVALA